MSALTTYRYTPEYQDNTFLTLVAASAVQQGGMVAINASGKAVPAADTAGLRVIGRAENYAATGDEVKIRMGVFGWDNSSDNAVAATDVGNVCYVEDDHTVGMSSGSNAIAAGVVKGIDEEGYVIVAPAALTAVIPAGLLGSDASASA